MHARERIAVVTGANRGIGLGVARQLLKQGLQVVLAGRDAQKVKAAAASLGEGAEAMVLDVSDGASIRRFAKAFGAVHARLDVLVNNAGIIGRGSAHAIDPDELDRVLATNYTGAVKLTNALMPWLRKSADGRIVNVSSGMGAMDDLTHGYAPYRLSKWNLNGFTILLANELRGTPIRVFAMCPGWVRTEMGGQSAGRSVERGADTAVWLATASDAKSGYFYRDRKIIAW